MPAQYVAKAQLAAMFAAGALDSLESMRRETDRQSHAICDGGLRRAPALRFPDVPAVVGRREFGAHALPAGA